MFSWFKKSAPHASAEGLLATKADQKGVKPQFHSLAVREVRRETPESVSVAFAVPEGGSFRFIPGQYLTLRATLHYCSEPVGIMACVAPVQVGLGGRSYQSVTILNIRFGP